MKVACLQFAPEVGRVDENIARADKILARSALPEDLDWLVLPELAFSGYNFPSLTSITPYLEPTTAGPTTRWAITTAQRLGCHVTAGYPEQSGTSERYNSTVTVSPTGAILANYRKSFLYYTDETWAREGPGDLTHRLSSPTVDAEPFLSARLGALGKVTLGICMDINPYQFTTPWEACEFAAAGVRAGSRVFCVSMAWLCLLPLEALRRDPGMPHLETLMYWVKRFGPVVEANRDMQQEPVFVVLANRCGVEGEAHYAGSSTVLRIADGGVGVYGALGKSEEDVLVVDLEGRPRVFLKSGDEGEDEGDEGEDM